MTVHATVIYVDAGSSIAVPTGQSWDTAFPSLTDALAIARSGDQVWVAQGIYRVSAAEPTTFKIASGVALYGGFAGTESELVDRKPAFQETILSGDVAANDAGGFFDFVDNATHVITIEGSSSPAIIDGITIDAGFADDDVAEHGFDGAELLVLNGVSYLRNCRLGSGFTFGFSLVGLFDSVAVFEKCDFSSPLAPPTSVVTAWGGSMVMSDCVFAANAGTSLAGEDGCVLVVDRCAFLSNSGYGLTCYGLIEATIRRCRFAGNLSGAILNMAGARPTITDCVFTGNKAMSGAAINNDESHPLMLRNLFASNEASVAGGAIFNISGSVPILRSSILWHNSVNGVIGPGTQITNVVAAIDIADCCVEGGAADLLGVDCIDVDPGLVDLPGPDGVIGTADDDPRLAAWSPCIDAGSESDSTLDVDIVGYPRVQDGDLDGNMRVDMGAAEFCNVRLEASTHVALSGATYLSIEIDGPPTLLGMLFAGHQPGLVPAPPFGALLFDPSYDWSRFALGPLPASVICNVTPLVGLLEPLTLQALGVKPGAGNLSNGVALDLDP